MSVETIRARQAIVKGLSDDLNILGWDQPNKLWFLKGPADDEWMEFSTEVSGAPENHLVKLIAKSECPEDATGVVISTEGWEYPASLQESFKSLQDLQAYWRLLPPSTHRKRVEVRQVVLVSADGEVVMLKTRRGDAERDVWTTLAPDEDNTSGDRIVDAGRALFGNNAALVERIRGSELGSGLSQVEELLAPIRNIAKVIEAAQSGSIDSDQATLGIFNSMPESVRIKMVETMPDVLKDILRGLLSAEEVERYGL